MPLTEELLPLHRQGHDLLSARRAAKAIAVFREVLEVTLRDIWQEHARKQNPFPLAQART